MNEFNKLAGAVCDCSFALFALIGVNHTHRSEYRASSELPLVLPNHTPASIGTISVGVSFAFEINFTAVSECVN